MDAPRRIAPAPEHVAELALTCTEYVRRSTGSMLDYTPETLPLLDAYVREARGESRQEIVQLIAPAVGAYFGEVLRKTFDCRWHAPTGEFALWRVEFRECFLYFNPIGMAVEAIRLEDTDGLGASITTFDDSLDELREHLESSAPVRVQDYYALSTRFEVVDQIVHHLLVRRGVQSQQQYDAAFYQEFAAEDAPPEA